MLLEIHKRNNEPRLHGGRCSWEVCRKSRILRCPNLNSPKFRTARLYMIEFAEIFWVFGRALRKCEPSNWQLPNAQVASDIPENCFNFQPSTALIFWGKLVRGYVHNLHAEVMTLTASPQYKGLSPWCHLLRIRTPAFSDSMDILFEASGP